MATWEDGPEYAPLARPSEFTDPGLPPLDVVSPVSPPPDVPVDQPAYAPPAQPQTDLAAIVPPQAPARDPQEPFAVLTLATPGGGPPDGEAWTPTQPLGPTLPAGPMDVAPRPVVAPLAQINAPSFPAPGTPQWFAPGQLPAPQPATVTLRDVARAATAPVLIFAAIGGLFNQLALPMLVLALVATSRIAYRRRAVTATVGVTGALLTLVAFVSIFNGDDPYVLYGVLCDTSQVVSWAFLVALVIVMYRALSLRERPERW